MPDLPPHALEIAIEVGRVVAAPGTIEERAGALLDPLHRIVPFQAVCIALVDMRRTAALALVSAGYDEATLAYIESSANVEELEMLGFSRERAPMRLEDLAVPLEQVPGWVDHLGPAGFTGGLGVGLFAADGRSLGVLGMNTDDPGHPTEAARDFIGTLAPMIANAIDPLRSVVEAARIVGDPSRG